MDSDHLASSYRMITEALDILEGDWRPVSTAPKGEPQLGKRGLYDALGGDPEAPAKRRAFLWILNLADGGHSLLDMAERSGLRFSVIADAADLLEASGLLTGREGDDDAASNPTRP